jgi:hypothetical protein
MWMGAFGERGLGKETVMAYFKALFRYSVSKTKEENSDR